MKMQEQEFRIEPRNGGISVFVPIEAEALSVRTAQELLIKAQQALLAYFAVIASEKLPVIV